MSFNVTQCPACESTFNTNSRVLAAAAGKVRCGACLNVFEAVDHFLTQNEDGAREDQDESVFVGNDPQEYFDPSSFLTRSALREPPVEEEAEEDPIVDQFQHEELEGHRTIPDEFFTSVLEELRGRVTARKGDAEPEQEQEAESEPAPQLLLQHSPEVELDDALEEDILAAFSEEPLEDTALEIEPPTDPGLIPHAAPPEDEPVSTATAELADESEHDATLNSIPEPELPTGVGGDAEAPDEPYASAASLPPTETEAVHDSADAPPPAPASESQTVPSQNTPVGLELSATFTFGHAPEPEPSPAASEQPRASDEDEAEQLQHTLDSADAEDEQDAEHFLDTVAEELEQDVWSLDEQRSPEEVSAQDDAGEFEAAAEDIEPIANMTESLADIDAEDSAQETDIEVFDIGEDIAEVAIDASPDEGDDAVAAADADSAPASASDEESSEHGTLLGAPDQIDREAEKEAETEAREQQEPAELDDSTEAIRARALEAELDDEDALEAIPSENLAALGSMSPPVEFLAGKDSRLLRSSLLLLSIVFLSALLSGQYLWQRMALYSQLPQLRGAYQFACARLGCELPEYRAIDAIRSENLSVQTHPTFENGLMVNTVIRNAAAFEQPFPILILSFNSAENSIVALREFSADEYLDPGLRSTRMMPPMTPVQIGLAIMDPGPMAVNYTLAFRFP